MRLSRWGWYVCLALVFCLIRHVLQASWRLITRGREIGRVKLGFEVHMPDHRL